VLVQPFEQVVTEHGAVVLRVCRALLRGSDADDAWSETFLSALTAYPTLRPDSNVRAWLVTIAHRKAIDQIRSASRRPLPIGNLPDRTSVHVVSVGDELRNALRQLTDRQQHAVVYRHIGDLSYDDIAELLECSKDAARRSVADGLIKLRDIYGERVTK
jgi:RNA polymerase sigma factor (sigma-70 family)